MSRYFTCLKFDISFTFYTKRPMTGNILLLNFALVQTAGKILNIKKMKNDIGNTRVIWVFKHYHDITIDKN